MQGYYVPYWFYDYKTVCYYQGEGTKVRVWRSGDKEYTETSVYAIERSMDMDFERIPVDASEQMPDDVMDLLAPFQYGQMVDFSPRFMSGFYGEKYNMPTIMMGHGADEGGRGQAPAGELCRVQYGAHRAGGHLRAGQQGVLRAAAGVEVHIPI